MELSVCIFAHNEERLLPKCVGALDAAAAGADFRAHILVNGATDLTFDVAKTLAAADPRITAHNLPVADKANAWNDYVFRISGDAAVHVFLDGDIAPRPGALAELARALKTAPRAYGAAAVPACGRSRRAWARELVANRCLSGNLYAMSGRALDVFRAKDLRLPFGMKGEDGFIAYLLLTDLKCGADDTHDERLVAAPGAAFEFDSLGLNHRDARTYHRRLIRYSERHFQKAVLYRRLKRHGAAALPENISEIYTSEALRGLRPRLDPVNFWYDWTTLRRLRTQAQRLKPRFA